jgi:hypothetical protein
MADKSSNEIQLPTITFQSKRFNAQLGIRVGEVLADKLSCAPEDLVGVMDQVFPDSLKCANVQIMVNPFYPHYLSGDADR